MSLPPSWIKAFDQSVTNYIAGILASSCSGTCGHSSWPSWHLGRSKMQSPLLHSQHKAKETLEHGQDIPTSHAGMAKARILTRPLENLASCLLTRAPQRTCTSTSLHSFSTPHSAAKRSGPIKQHGIFLQM